MVHIFILQQIVFTLFTFVVVCCHIYYTEVIQFFSVEIWDIRNSKRAANMTKIKTNVKKGEVRLVEQRSFVGWKYGPCREKKLKIALLNETDFKVKFKFKVENCVLQISVHPFLGWNIWQNSTRPLFSYILDWNWKGKSKYVYFGLKKSIWNIWVRLKWGTRMKFPSEIFGCA